MKVVITTTIYPPMIGGAGAVMHSLAAHSNGEIEIIASEYDRCGKLTSGGHHRDPAVHRISRFERDATWLPPGTLRGISQAAFDNFLLRPRIKRECFRILDRLQPDIVCAGTPGCWWIADHLSEWRKGAKLLFVVHGEEVPGGNGYHDRLRMGYLRRASAIIAVSRFTSHALQAAGIPEERIAVINNGVNTGRFCPGEKSQQILDRYNLRARCVIMTLARLDERKGQDMLIRALPEIRRSIPDLVYLVVGDGDYASKLRSIVSELHLEETVIFTGAVDDQEVPDFYRTCDLYAMPNRTTASGDTEGFGLVFLEAGACCKPVIGGNAGGVPDAIQDGITGLLVDGTSVSSIAEACVRLLRDTQLRARMGANGLAHARNNAWHFKTKQFLELCKDVI